jgi:hypothetical protein
MITEDLGHETLTIRDGDPLSIVNQVQRTLVYERDEWRIRIDTDSKLPADVDNFHVTCLLEGFESDSRVFAKTWTFTIPRDLI